MSARANFPRDVASAYLASLSRVVSWVIVSAMVFRRSTEAFALLALVRGTLGILNYASLGLLPAMIRMLASSPPLKPRAEAASDAPDLTSPAQVTSPHGPALNYASPVTTREDRFRRRHFIASPETQAIFSTGILVACATALCGILAIGVIEFLASYIYRVPPGIDAEDLLCLVMSIGAGIVLRWFSEPAAAVLQTSHAITLDNVLVVASELFWILLTIAFAEVNDAYHAHPLRAVGFAHATSGALLALARMNAASTVAGVQVRLPSTCSLLRPLLLTGSLITLAQLADYLYGPTDFILINRLLSTIDLANYAPAMQIDSGLLLLVTGLSAVLLPRAALAHAAGDVHSVRRDYVRATLASAALLATASVVIYFASPFLFKLWLGQDMPGTRAILPLVLCHTTIGGSAMIGRSILLATGRTTPFAISVLIAGLTNVIASYVFVRYFHWGLKGIVAGTIVAVLLRCVVWMPWYILRTLKTAAPVAEEVLIPPVA